MAPWNTVGQKVKEITLKMLELAIQSTSLLLPPQKSVPEKICSESAGFTGLLVYVFVLTCCRNILPQITRSGLNDGTWLIFGLVSSRRHPWNPAIPVGYLKNGCHTGRWRRRKEGGLIESWAVEQRCLPSLCTELPLKILLEHLWKGILI